MYVILTTFPEERSGNIGDKLITASAIEMLRQLKGEEEFLTLFREIDLTTRLDEVNGSRAVVMPGFAIRQPMYPDIYRLVPDLGSLEVPLIPLGTGSQLFPGDTPQVQRFRYSDETVNFLRRIREAERPISCRDYLTARLLERHELPTRMVGDCAWYDMASLGTPMRRPRSIDRLVFTTPHRALYVSQAKRVLELLADLFPAAQRYLSLQSKVGPVEERLVPHGEKYDFEVVECSHDLDRITFYETCDLHVGYRVHGHLAFLRKRIPSVLLAEDSRGLGFVYTMGGGGIPVGARKGPDRLHRWLREAVRELSRRNVRRAWRQVRGRGGGVEPRRVPLLEEVRALLLEELSSGFRRYVPFAPYIDEVFEKEMQPFVEALP